MVGGQHDTLAYDLAHRDPAVPNRHSGRNRVPCPVQTGVRRRRRSRGSDRDRGIDCDRTRDRVLLDDDGVVEGIGVAAQRPGEEGVMALRLT